MDDTAEKKPTIEEILQKQRLSIDDLVKCGSEGLKAQKIIRDRFGSEVDTEPDFPTRHKFFASFLELLGYMKRDNNIAVNVVNLSTEEKELLEAYKRVPTGAETVPMHQMQSTSGISIETAFKRNEE